MRAVLLLIAADQPKVVITTTIARRMVGVIRLIPRITQPAFG